MLKVRFVCFLGEVMAWQFCFKIYWTLWWKNVLLNHYTTYVLDKIWNEICPFYFQLDFDINSIPKIKALIASKLCIECAVGREGYYFTYISSCSQ